MSHPPYNQRAMLTEPIYGHANSQSQPTAAVTFNKMTSSTCNRAYRLLTRGMTLCTPRQAAQHRSLMKTGKNCTQRTPKARTLTQETPIATLHCPAPRNRVGSTGKPSGSVFFLRGTPVVCSSEHCRLHAVGQHQPGRDGNPSLSLEHSLRQRPELSPPGLEELVVEYRPHTVSDRLPLLT